MPFDTVIWPVPPLPTNTTLGLPLLVVVNCPPVIHTVPVAFTTGPMINEEQRTVATPETVNVPNEPAALPTSMVPVFTVPAATIIWPVATLPTVIWPLLPPPPCSSLALKESRPPFWKSSWPSIVAVAAGAAPPGGASTCNEEFSTSNTPPEPNAIPRNTCSRFVLPAVLSSSVLVAPGGAATVRLLMVIVFGKLLIVVASIVTVLVMSLVIRTPS